MTRNNKFLQPVESCSVVSFRTARPLGARTIRVGVFLSNTVHVSSYFKPGFEPGFIFTWTFLFPDYKITSMKKICFLVVLCLAPFFVSHASDLTAEDCENYAEYWEETSQANFDMLHPLIQNLRKTQENIKPFISDKKYDYLREKDVELELFSVCIEVNAGVYEDEKTKSRTLKILTLSLEKALADYEKIETRARMPFVHHGNVLPGPEEEENGSIYLEQKFLPKFINATLIFLMSLSILMIIIGGLMYVFSSGDSEMTSRGKTTILWAIVGVVITILSYAIVQFIIGIDFTL